MIVIKVELHSAITLKITELVRVFIANDGTSRVRTRGDYDVWVGRKGVTMYDKIMSAPIRRGRVLNHPRHSTHILTLVRKALQAAGFVLLLSAGGWS